ncbi:PD40 domain-containing protein, partial [Candidatus Babeliales bacterium]|nr:PD40 domain-containing protein [Candidatus Babeliales bacterium]
MNKSLLSVLIFLIHSQCVAYDSLFLKKEIKIEIIEKREEDKGLTFEARTNELTHGKIKVLVLCIGDEELSTSVGRVFRKDLEFTDQLEVDLRKSKKELSKKDVPKLFNQGVSIYCLLKTTKNSVSILVQDTSSKNIIFDKKFACDTNDSVACGNMLSSNILPELTGESSIALYDLAYCRLINPRHKIICVGNYNAQYSRVAVSMETVNIVPCWHAEKPILFYSQITPKNMRLMAVDLKSNRHKIVCSFEGLNMQPSISSDGKKVVLCLSRSGNSELYLYDTDFSKEQGRRVFRQLTNNRGNNVSPSLLSNGDIVFCSDFKTGAPQIFYLDNNNKKILQLTHGGYCSEPSYCENNRSIVFTKPVNGSFQIFRINLNKDNTVLSEEQLTSNSGDKHHPSCSENGKYIVFSYRISDDEGRMTPQIASLNISSGRIRILTKGPQAKSFPTWRKKITTINGKA